MSDPHDVPRRFDDVHRARFFAHLDRIAARDRPVYGFAGQRPSWSQRLGGGTSYVLVLFFPDHVVVSTRRMASDRETTRDTRLLGEIASIAVAPGPLRSTVTVGFVDGRPLRLAGVPASAAEPLAEFDEHGLAAFGRERLSTGAVRAFFVACSRVLPLPDGLFDAGD